MSEVSYFVGLDLGQASDYTALAVVEKHAHPVTKGNRREEEIDALHCRHLQRYELGTLYPAIVDDVASMLKLPELRGAQLIVDATGVGRGVADMFGAIGVKPRRVVVTAGNSVNVTGGFWHVPKRDLVAAAQVPLHQKILKFAEMPLKETLITEMTNFKIKITESANDTYGAWREGQHDDLIFAVMLACWWARRRPPGEARSYDGGDEARSGGYITVPNSAWRSL